jgi:hypothetical protein
MDLVDVAASAATALIGVGVGATLTDRARRKAEEREEARQLQRDEKRARVIAELVIAELMNATASLDNATASAEWSTSRTLPTDVWDRHALELVGHLPAGRVGAIVNLMGGLRKVRVDLAEAADLAGGRVRLDGTPMLQVLEDLRTEAHTALVVFADFTAPETDA